MSRLFIDNSFYFITIPTINLQNFFNTIERKRLLLNRIVNARDKFQIDKLDYGIIASHYHIAGYFKDWQIISKFLQWVNGGSSFELNKFDNKPGRKIWDEYHMYYIRDEEVLYKIRGYVIGNPYKHQEIESLEELEKYPFSSYQNLVAEFGREKAEDCVLSVIKMSDEDILKEIKVKPWLKPV